MSELLKTFQAEKGFLSMAETQIYQWEKALNLKLQGKNGDKENICNMK